jgi:hypothetical protein
MLGGFQSKKCTGDEFPALAESRSLPLRHAILLSSFFLDSSGNR